jgi:hypothetical protein
MVRKRGFEPPLPCGNKLLRLARLPVPPLPHEGGISTGRNPKYNTRHELDAVALSRFGLGVFVGYTFATK